MVEILKKHWGYDSFRPMQREIIESVLAGHDTLGLLPTGAGKSITFQVPSLAREGVTLVITPLIALMKDQVDNLKKHRIRAAFLHSGMTRSQVTQVWQALVADKCKFLYVAPERLLSSRFMDEIRTLHKVSHVVIDEAHCISQWGYDFRPAYLGIAALRKVVNPDVPFLALTASATPHVADDIRRLLGFRSGHRTFSTSFSRPNISYVVRQDVNRIDHIAHILRRVPGTSIVYVRSRRLTGEIAAELQQYGIAAQAFHAGLEYELKEERIASWKIGETRVMVATNAFGMGIDKPDVRTVIHYDLPPSLEEYYQEAGRAGRDGKQSYAVLLTDSESASRMKRRLTAAFPDRKTIRLVYERVCNFLNIALEEGYDRIFAFDIEKFCRTFRMQRAQVETSLSLLGAAGYMTHIEERDAGSRVQIIVTREELYDISERDVNANNVLRALLRLCPGIFADYVYFSERKVAELTTLSQEQVYETLIRLRRKGLIQYVPRSATPLVYLPTSREEPEYVKIPVSVYEERRATMLHRVQSVLDFACDDGKCRARKILEYFGEKDATDCGTCDNCRTSGKAARPKSSDSIQSRLLALLDSSDRGVSTVEIDRIFLSDAPKAMEFLDFMAEQGDVLVQSAGPGGNIYTLL
ncbi:MAG: RecQ family ATP-dependent DNA helicase [Lachnospiraceae bacterium]|nr:RecQ family ATP-dependent DNA helicase [Lachnospiraceae bacterium]